MGTLGDFCPSLVVNINPSKLMKRKCEKVTRFPQPASEGKNKKGNGINHYKITSVVLTFIDQEL